eukprot:s11296_g1.t1
MVESDFHATRLGSMLYELSGSLDKEPQIQRAIELTFAKKAPATLHKRTLAFWKLFKFHSDRGHKSGLHMSEASIFAYFESLTRGAATAPQSCLEALFFMHTLLGLRVPIDDLVSHRIRGLVYEAAVQKRPLKQARPLTVEEVAAMLAKIQDGSFRPDASAAGLIEQQLHQEKVASDELERKLHGEPCTLEDSASEDLGHDDADQAAVDAVPSAERRMVLAPNPSQYLVHLSSGTLHAIASGSECFRRPRVAIPDCTLLLDALDSMSRMSLQLDTIPTLASVEQYAKSLTAELEVIAVSGVDGGASGQEALAKKGSGCSPGRDEHGPSCAYLHAAPGSRLPYGRHRDLCCAGPDYLLLLRAHDAFGLFGAAACHLEPIVDADRTLWVLVAQETRGKVLTSGAPLPIDAAVDAFKDAPDVAFALLPRSKGSVPPPPKSTPSADSEAMTRAKRRRLAKAKGKQAVGATGKPSAPGNTSKGNGGKGIDIPSGAKTRDDQGRPICFRYNRKACDQSVCWFCLKSHPGADHKE